MERARRPQQQQGWTLPAAARAETATAAVVAHAAPASLKEAQDELRYLRSDCKLKDDTIKFLQREKECLQREVQHYEKLCAGVESEVFVSAQSEAENARLRDELERAKDALRRQRLQIRALSSSSSSGGGGGRATSRYDGDDDKDEAAASTAAAVGALGTSVCGRLVTLLRGDTAPASRKLQQCLIDEAPRYGHAAASRPELCVELLSLVDRALAELCECARRQHRQGGGGTGFVTLSTADLTSDGNGRPVLRYAYGAAAPPLGAETAYGRVSSEEVMLARRQHHREATARSAVAAVAARASTAPSGHGPAFVGIDRSTVLPGLKPVRAMASSGGRQ